MIGHDNQCSLWREMRAACAVAGVVEQSIQVLSDKLLIGR